MEFNKGDYIVYTGEGCLSFKKDHCYKQREKCKYLRSVLDSKGGKSNGWSAIISSDYSNWRYATYRETLRYEKLGKPYNTNTLNVTKLNLNFLEPYDLVEKTVHCETLKEAVEFCNIMHEAGAVWAYKKSSLCDYVGFEGTNTCYYITNCGGINTARLKDAIEGGIEVIKAKDFLINNIYSNLNKSKNEVFRKTIESEGSGRKGVAIRRRKFKIASGLRLVGSKATNFRKRERVKRSKISSRNLQLD